MRDFVNEMKCANLEQNTRDILNWFESAKEDIYLEIAHEQKALSPLNCPLHPLNNGNCIQTETNMMSYN